MKFIEFTEKEIIGIKEIDNQHKEMVDIVNELYEHLSKGKSKSISKMFERLVTSLKIHFETEERLMLSLKFPGYFSHKLEHDRFYNQVLSFKGSSTDKNKLLKIEDLESIRRWFFNHLEISDRKMRNIFI